jgi:hypothetical protein
MRAASRGGCKSPLFFGDAAMPAAAVFDAFGEATARQASPEFGIALRSVSRAAAIDANGLPARTGNRESGLRESNDQQGRRYSKQCKSHVAISWQFASRGDVAFVTHLAKLQSVHLIERDSSL